MQQDRLDMMFAALADPTRRAILARLAEGEATVNELAAPFDLTQPSISKHLKVLERAGLISRGRAAQTRRPGAGTGRRGPASKALPARGGQTPGATECPDSAAHAPDHRS